MNPGTDTEPVISLGPAAHGGSCCLLASHHTSRSSSFPGLWGLKIEQKRPQSSFGLAAGFDPRPAVPLPFRAADQNQDAVPEAGGGWKACDRGPTAGADGIDMGQLEGEGGRWSVTGSLSGNRASVGE